MIGSVAGLRGCPSTVAYQVVKGALPQMARALARDHGHEGIRVNVIEPGIIRTRFHRAMTPEAERNNLDNRIPLRRFGSPEQVATAAIELLTNPFISARRWSSTAACRCAWCKNDGNATPLPLGGGGPFLLTSVSEFRETGRGGHPRRRAPSLGVLSASGDPLTPFF